MLYIIGQAVIISAIIKEKLHTPYPFLESLYVKYFLVVLLV